MLWAIYLPERLTPTARSILVDKANVRLVSEATLWETLAKAGRGKLPYPGSSFQPLPQHPRTASHLRLYYPA